MSTTIVGMLDKEHIIKNIEALHRPLDDVEIELQEYIKRHFSKLTKCNWEGIEVDAYWNSLNKSL